MRVSTLSLGLIAATAEALVTKATIDNCLRDSGVPYDIKGSEEWSDDIAPFNLRLPYIPTSVAVPRKTEHISKAVVCGKKLGIKVSAKSGGHSYASYGLGGENGHLIIEFDQLYDVTYDAKTNIATVEPGARLGHVATVLNNKYGRGIAHGTCPGVGVSGHFLHGGFGFSSHTHGLALDFVEAVTIVLADGSVVEASEKKYSDLFWAVRGAGSNYGIVAAWKLRTFPAPQVLTRFAVTLNWNKGNAVQGIEAVQSYAKNTAPREINFRVGDYGKGNPGIEGLYWGPEAAWRKAFQPLLDTLPAGYNVSEVSNVNWIQSVISYSNFPENIDFTFPQPPENFYAKSLAIKELSHKAVQNFVDYYFDVANNVVDRFWFYQLDVHGGKNSQISKVADDATSYAHRDKLFLIQFYDRYENNETYPDSSFGFLDGWVKTVTDATPKSDWGAYANYADPRLPRETALNLYYGDHLPTLKKIKSKYDPKRLFDYPQAVTPA